MLILNHLFFPSCITFYELKWCYMDRKQAEVKLMTKQNCFSQSFSFRVGINDFSLKLSVQFTQMSVTAIEICLKPAELGKVMLASCDKDSFPDCF